MSRSNIYNLFFFIIAAYVIYMRAPGAINHFKHQDQKATDFTIQTLKGDSFQLGHQSKKMVIVFWATWCGPCDVELSRINKMIINKTIDSQDVLAVASNEDIKTIARKVLEEKYLFNVGIDADGVVAQNYNITSTPTIVFINDSQVINWMTSGISPTLQYRISTFLK